MGIKITKLGKAFGLGRAMTLEAEPGPPGRSKNFDREQWIARKKRNTTAKRARRRNRRQRRGQRR